MRKKIGSIVLISMLLIVTAISVTAKTETTSNGLNPTPATYVPSSQPKTLDDIMAIAFCAYDSSGATPQGPITFSVANPGALTSIVAWAPGSNGFCTGAAMINDGTLFMTDYGSASSGFWQVDPVTGDHTQIGSCGKSIHAMTWDPTTDTVYAAGGAGNAQTFYSVDVTTGAVTKIGDFGGGLAYVLLLGCDASGQVYCIDISTDNLYTVDKTTGVATQVGATGQSLNYAQDMAFSQIDNTMYVAGYVSSGSLFTCDLTSGHLTTIGQFQGGAEVDAMVVPGIGDKVPPVTTISFDGVVNNGTYYTDVTCTLTATDGDGSGVASTNYQIDDGTWQVYTAPFVIKTDGTHTINYYSVDKRGNSENQSTATIKIAHAISIVIKGGLGITATITNNAPISFDTTWKIKVDNCVCWIGSQKSSSGTVTIGAGKSIKAKDFVMGIGNPKITVTAFQTSQTVTGKLFLFFVSGI